MPVFVNILFANCGNKDLILQGRRVGSDVSTFLEDRRKIPVCGGAITAYGYFSAAKDSHRQGDRRDLARVERYDVR
jgi:hypothetical protein